MAANSSILFWEIPWTEESGRLQVMGSKRAGCDLVTETLTKTKIETQLPHTLLI